MTRIIHLLLGLLAAAALLLVLILGFVFFQPSWGEPLLAWLLAPAGGSATVSIQTARLWPPRLGLARLTILGPAYELDLRGLDLEPEPRALWSDAPWFRRVELGAMRLETTAAGETQGPTRLSLAPLELLRRVEHLRARRLRIGFATAGGWRIMASGLECAIDPDGADRELSLSGALLVLDPGGRPQFTTQLEGRGRVTPGPVLTAQLDLPQARLGLARARGALSSQARLRLAGDRWRLEDLRLALDDPELVDAAGQVWRPGPAVLELAAGGDLGGGDLSVDLGRLALGQVLAASGRLAGPDWEGLSGRVAGDLAQPQELWARLAPGLPSPAAELTWSGALDWSVEVSPGPTWRARLRPKGLAVAWPARGLTTTLAGDAGVSPRGLEGALTITADWRSTGWGVQGLVLSLPLAGDLVRPRSPGFGLGLPAGGLLVDGQPLKLGEWRLAGDLARADDAWRLDQLTLTTPAGGLGGQAVWGDQGPGGTLAGSDLDLAALAPLLAARSTETGAWSLSGRLDLELGLGPGVGAPALDLGAKLHKVSFSSPQGASLGQDLSGGFTLRAPLEPWPRLSVGLDLGRGQVLVDTVFLDLVQRPLKLKADGKPRGGGVRELAARLELGGLGNLQARGDAELVKGQWDYRGDLKLHSPDLGALFATLVRDPLSAQHPALAQMTVAGGGTLSLSGQGLGPQATVKGHLNLQGAGLEDPQGGLSLEGLELDLPISYRWGGRPPAATTPKDADWGSLSLTRLKAADLNAGPLTLGLALVPGRLHSKGSVTLPLYGGRLDLGGLTVERPLEPDFAASLRVALSGLDLARLPGQEVRLEGRLEGTLDPVRVDAQRLTSRGRLTGDFFGGDLAVTDLQVSQPFDPSRELGADLVIRGMDLERFTQSLGAGLITGRLDGQVDRLRLAYGQPVAFKMRFESREAEGVDQNVSLKAVNSISVVGTGSGLSGVGVGLFSSIMNQFPYQKIGFACSLKNDVFRLQGLIKEGDLEYLVKKPPFMGINVINRNPDNRISFSDMLERLQRVLHQDSSS